MNKTLKWVLIAILGIIFVVFILPILLGFFSTLNPSGAAQKGKCVAQCNSKYNVDDPIYEECMGTCAGLTD